MSLNPNLLVWWHKQRKLCVGVLALLDENLFDASHSLNM